MCDTTDTVNDKTDTSDIDTHIISNECASVKETEEENIGHNEFVIEEITMNSSKSESHEGDNPVAPAPMVPVKLYIGGLPVSMSEDDIKHFFEKYGKISDFVVFKDKNPKVNRNCAFITYVTIHYADKAISDLHNKHKFADCEDVAQVEYAQGEVERIGLTGFAMDYGKDSGKLFSASIPKGWNEEELKSLFSPYGKIEEIHVMRDSFGTGKGCAFIRYACKEQALCAIKTLHSSETLETCNRPLEVRFAEQRKKEYYMNNSTNTNTANNAGNSNKVNNMSNKVMATAPRQAGGWKEYFTAEGRAYYHNESTGVTQWEVPPDFNRNMTGNTTNYNNMVSHNNKAVENGPPGSNVFVFHIPNEWTHDDLIHTFGSFGPILSAKIATDNKTGRNRGYAFVSYTNVESAAKAVLNMNGFMAHSKKLKVTIKRGEEKYVKHLLEGPAAESFSRMNVGMACNNTMNVNPNVSMMQMSRPMPMQMGGKNSNNMMGMNQNAHGGPMMSMMPNPGNMYNAYSNSGHPGTQWNNQGNHYDTGASSATY